jgi:hypothetical protein
MAKHKKKRAHKVSKGLRNAISPSTVRAVRADRSPVDVYTNKLNAWKKGKRGYVTIPNPDASQTNRRFIRVPFTQAFGGLYKDIKSRVRRADENQRIEL